MSDYTPSGAPVTSSSGSSSAIRAEFALIQTAIASKADSASPTLTTPTLGVATATSINKITLTQPATGATLTLTDGKTLSVAKTLTLTGTDGTTMTFPATSASVARIDAAQTFTGIQDFDGRIDANAGLAVTGANFTSRGITDSATAVAMTLSGSGANSVTIANSATNPTIGTSGGALTITSNTGPVLITGAAAQTLTIQSLTTGISVLTLGNATNAARGQVSADNSGELYLASFATGGINLYTAGGTLLQVVVTNTASATRYITLTGSNGGNPTIGTSAGSLAITPPVIGAGYLQAVAATATPAGGTAGAGVFMGSIGIGIYFGSGAPTVSASKGSIYLRSDGSATNNRMYVNTDGGTTWTAVTTAA